MYVTIVRLAGALLPSCAVLLGLYGLGSAWAAILLYHFGIVAFALIVRGRTLRGRGEGGDSTSPAPRLVSGRRVLVAALVAAALSAPAMYLLWPWMVRTGVSLESWLAHLGMQGLSWWLFVPYYGLLHPVLEELHWARLGEGLPLRPGPTDLLFAGYHLLVLATLVRWPWLPIIFVSLLGSSVAWRRMYRHRETRSVPWLSHALADLGIVLVASLLRLQGR